MTRPEPGREDGPRKRERKEREAGPPPSREILHEAALGYLTRSAATAATLRRALERKIALWARRAQKTRDAEAIAEDVATCRAAVDAIIARMREVGLVNDAAFAEARVRGLSRAGRSRRAISAHLTAKGIDSETARRYLPNDAGMELAAALTFAKKKRIGPYSREPSIDRADRQKQLAAMARAGFDWSTCERALRMDREEADERLQEHRG